MVRALAADPGEKFGEGGSTGGVLTVSQLKLGRLPKAERKGGRTMLPRGGQGNWPLPTRDLAIITGSAMKKKENQIEKTTTKRGKGKKKGRGVFFKAKKAQR